MDEKPTTNRTEANEHWQGNIADTLAYLVKAIQARLQWEAQGEPINGRHWVAAGNDAISALDRVRWHVSDARAGMVAAMKADADARAERVDAMTKAHYAIEHGSRVSAGGEVTLAPRPPIDQ